MIHIYIENYITSWSFYIFYFPIEELPNLRSGDKDGRYEYKNPSFKKILIDCIRLCLTIEWKYLELWSLESNHLTCDFYCHNCSSIAKEDLRWFWALYKCAMASSDLSSSILNSASASHNLTLDRMLPKCSSFHNWSTFLTHLNLNYKIDKGYLNTSSCQASLTTPLKPKCIAQTLRNRKEVNVYEESKRDEWLEGCLANDI